MKLCNENGQPSVFVVQRLYTEGRTIGQDGGVCPHDWSIRFKRLASNPDFVVKVAHWCGARVEPRSMHRDPPPCAQPLNRPRVPGWQPSLFVVFAS